MAAHDSNSCVFAGPLPMAPVGTAGSPAEEGPAVDGMAEDVRLGLVEAGVDI